MNCSYHHRAASHTTKSWTAIILLDLFSLNTWRAFNDHCPVGIGYIHAKMYNRLNYWCVLNLTNTPIFVLARKYKYIVRKNDLSLWPDSCCCFLKKKTNWQSLMSIFWISDKMQKAVKKGGLTTKAYIYCVIKKKKRNASNVKKSIIITWLITSLLSLSR